MKYGLRRIQFSLLYESSLCFKNLENIFASKTNFFSKILFNLIKFPSKGYREPPKASEKLGAKVKIEYFYPRRLPVGTTALMLGKEFPAILRHSKIRRSPNSISAIDDRRRPKKLPHLSPSRRHLRNLCVLFHGQSSILDAFSKKIQTKVFKIFQIFEEIFPSYLFTFFYLKIIFGIKIAKPMATEQK